LVIGYQLSVIGYQLSVISYQLSVIGFQAGIGVKGLFLFPYTGQNNPTGIGKREKE